MKSILALVLVFTFSVLCLSSQIILGHVTERTATIKVDTVFNYSVKNLQTGNDYGTENRMPFGMPFFSMNKIEINDLEPGKEYEIVLLHKKTGVKDTVNISTPKLWAYRTDPPELTVTFGSCSFVNDSMYDRPGDGYGNSSAIFRAVANKNPDMHIWLGDNWYYRESDWTSKVGMEYRVNFSRNNSDMQTIFDVPNYAIWDDHDYGPNDSDKSLPLKKSALQVFESAWANPKAITGSSYYTSFTRDGVEFILLDNRAFRSPNNYSDNDIAKQYFGRKQLNWLKDRLIASNTKFKVVCSGGQILNPTAEFETYSRFKNERTELLTFIENNNINGVIFLTGDRHYTELTLHPDFPIIDYTSSPISSGPYRKGCESKNDWKVDQTCYSDNNFGSITFKGGRKDRIAVLKCFDSVGNLVWEKQWDGDIVK